MLFMIKMLLEEKINSDENCLCWEVKARDRNAGLADYVLDQAVVPSIMNPVLMYLGEMLGAPRASPVLYSVVTIAVIVCSGLLGAGFYLYDKIRPKDKLIENYERVPFFTR